MAAERETALPPVISLRSRQAVMTSRMKDLGFSTSGWLRVADVCAVELRNLTIFFIYSAVWATRIGSAPCTAYYACSAKGSSGRGSGLVGWCFWSCINKY